MKIDVLTTFPEMFGPVLGASILKRAQEAGVTSIAIHDLRQWTTDKHQTTDDAPYGGGVGMVMKPEPFFAAVEGLLAGSAGVPPAQPSSSSGSAGVPPALGTTSRLDIILLTPQGELFTQALARELSAKDHLILLCGHYEGVDERVREHLATREISVGDYVLTGGELPAMVIIDAVVRLLPGALGAEEGAKSESFEEHLLEYPQYTRPAEFRGWRVPEMLLSGHHEQIRRWRRKESLRRTKQRRPDLLEKARLTAEDRELLEEIEEEAANPNPSL
jgi:tRNA (guanine37-N1)-methyltransferase